MPVMRIGIAIALVLLAIGKATGNMPATISAFIVLVGGIGAGLYLLWLAVKAWVSVR